LSVRTISADSASFLHSVLIFVYSAAANTAEHLPHYQALIDHGARLLFINGKPHDLAVPAVGDDEWIAGRMSARHVLELGHRKIGFITGVKTTSSRSHIRLSGVQDAANEFLDSQIFPLNSTWGVDGGFSGAKILLETDPEITALICTSDLTALGAMNYCHEQGINIPKDMSVLGSDGIDLCRWVSPTMSTIAQPIDAIANFVGLWLAEDISIQR
jgi:LacI family repressor for deo operon, udp, cdd, tsx, nupC, and nupG